MVEIDFSRDSLLTTFGIETLRDRYLLKEEKSPQEAFVRAAKAYADDDNHAHRIYDYASKLWLSFSTPILSNAGTKKGLPISCLTGDMWINTFGGAKKIADIRVGDLVLTHRNRFKPVTGVKTSNSQDIYVIKAYGRTTEIKITGNHLILTNLGWVKVEELNPLIHLIATNTFADYGEDHQKVISLARFSSKKDQTGGRFKETTITNNVKVDKGLMWALGWWFSEGSLSKDAKGRPNGIRFTLSVDEEDVANNLLGIFKDKFGANGNYYFSENKKGKGRWISVNINSHIIGKYFQETFGEGCKYKKLPNWFFTLNNALIREFLTGIFLGDGCLIHKNGTSMMTLTNPVLICQVYNLLLKLRQKTSLKLDTKPSKLGTTEFVYTVTWNKNTSVRRAKGIQFNDLLFYPIREVRKIENCPNTEVFDIQIEEDESFNVAGIIVHNCYLTSVPDSIKGLMEHYTENAFLASQGGGIGGFWGEVRSDGTNTQSGSKSTGIVPFMHVVDAQMLAFNQGTSRRGSYAAYLPIDHAEIEEFIIMRKPTGGDVNRKNLNLHHGVNVTHEFIRAINEGLDWELKDPHSGRITKILAARYLWQLLLETRISTGEPYINFIDTVNDRRPQDYPEISTSNLCNEIHLRTDEDHTAVCCLSSVNLEKYDEWRGDPLFISDIIRYLDNVLTAFITDAPSEFWRAKNSVMEERSLGLGAMGFHAYLQSKGIPFEGPLAVGINKQIFAYIKSEAEKETKRLAKERGAPMLGESRGVRNCHLMAVAPNASSSIVCGNTSPSIEPFRANAFVQKTLSGSSLIKSKYLERLLKDIGQDTEEVWQSIINNDGSVQHLDFLTDWQKGIYKTAIEIDQLWIIQHAADRQEYICQGQSVNLFFLPTANIKYLHKVHMAAWKKGLKGLYYLRSQSVKNSDNISEKIERIIRQEEPVCAGCEG